jgi:hypothetical protein
MWIAWCLFQAQVRNKVLAEGKVLLRLTTVAIKYHLNFKPKFCFLKKRSPKKGRFFEAKFWLIFESLRG